jgi:hypothetical protein
MRLKCTNCPAEMEFGVDDQDIGDSAYKLVCPVLREHYRNDAPADCPYMRTVKDAQALRRKRHR